MTNSKRIDWIDIVKFICCIFVIVSHLGHHKIAILIKPFYRYFALTGFLFAAGFTYNHRDDFGFFLKKKIKQLFIPWLSLSLINIVLSNIISFQARLHSGLWNDLLKNCLQVRGYGDTVWFIHALFVGFIPFYYFVKKYEEEKILGKNCTIKYILISTILFFLYTAYIEFMPASLFPWGSNYLPWHIEYIPFMVCFMFLGYICKDQYFEKINKKESNYIFLGTLSVYLIIIYSLEYSNISIPFILNTCILFISHCLSIMSIVMISKRIPINTYISFVGKNTLLYFALQGKLISLWEKILENHLTSLSSIIYGSPTLSILYSFIITFVFTLILMIPILIINKYFLFMAGKSKIKSEKR